MKTLLFILITLVLPHISFCQEKITYEASEPYKYMESHVFYCIPNADTTKTLNLNIHDTQIDMQLFDNKTMKELKHTSYKIPDEISSPCIYDIHLVGAKLYGFYWVVENQKWTYKCREIDFNLCRFTGKEKTIFTPDTYLSAFPSLNYPWPNLLSKDKSKFVTYFKQYPKKIKNSLNYDEFSFFLIDKNLKELARHDIKMPYTEKQMDNIQFIADSASNVYILAKVYAEDTKKGTDKANNINYQYEIFKINIKNKSFETIKIPVNNVVTDINISEGINGSIYCTGFYTQKKKEDIKVLGIQVSQASADGFFLLEINKNNEVVKQKHHEIPQEIINIYGTQNKEELANLKVVHLIHQEDKSIVLISEQVSLYPTNIYISTPVSGARHNMFYNDILIVKLNELGDIIWMKRLPKRQMGKDSDSDLSFGYQFIKNKHCFVFMDNVKNINLKLDQKPAPHESTIGGYLTVYQVDDMTSNTIKTSLFNTDNFQSEKGNTKKYVLSLFTNIRKITPSSNSSFIIEFYKKFEENIWVKVQAE